MKEMHLLVWLTQLGLTVAAPLGGFVLLAVWLRNRLGWGDWVIWVGLSLGFACAVSGFRSTVRQMARMAGDKEEPEPPAAFNDHA